jgi:hypothetical protein
MSAIFEAVIKTMPNGKWFIELRDSEKEDSFKECFSVEEFAQKLEEMGAEYNQDVQVAWSQEENVTDLQVHEVRMEMMAYEAKIADEDNQNQSQEHNNDGSPKF